MINPIPRAKELYEESTNNHPTIHCNRFPTWDELSRKAKLKWINQSLDEWYVGKE